MTKCVVAVQCDIVKQRCSGYMCEQNFNQRTGAFAIYDADTPLRFLPVSCDGCCGKAVHRKLKHVIKMAKQNDAIEPGEIAVHLSSCACKANYHSPPCPHIDYIRTLIGNLGLTVVDGTVINELSEKRRQDGTYAS